MKSGLLTGVGVVGVHFHPACNVLPPVLRSPRKLGALHRIAHLLREARLQELGQKEPDITPQK